MSHIVLTHDCNKGCSFCFAKQSRLRVGADGRHMSLEMLDSVLDKQPSNQSVKLLGGEPTLHPQFGEVLDRCLRRGFGVFLISNFLFSTGVRDSVLEALSRERTEMGFLANASELDGHGRMETFKANYEAVLQALRKRNREHALYCRITLGPNEPIGKYLAYVDYLRANLSKMPTLRISPSCPDRDTNNAVLGNTAIGDGLVALAEKIIDLGIEFRIDHTLYPCVYDTEDKYRLLQRYSMQGVKSGCGIVAAPADYMPDGTAMFCYVNPKITVDARPMGSDSEVNESLLSAANGIRDAVGLPKQCESCLHRANGACDGPCLGLLSY